MGVLERNMVASFVVRRQALARVVTQTVTVVTPKQKIHSPQRAKIVEFFKIWYPQRDSNSCYRLEKPVS